MTEARAKNIETSIDAICNSLVWAWRYQKALEGLSEGAKKKGKFESSGAFLNALWIGMLESLFMKVGQLLDKRKDSHSFHTLFTLAARYKLLEGSDIDSDRRLLSSSTPEKIKEWRNNRIAHLSDKSLDDNFFISNKISLLETEEFLRLCDGIINRYSQLTLDTIIDTEFAANGIYEQGVVLLATNSASLKE